MSLLEIFSYSSTVVLVLNAVLYSKFIISKDCAYRYLSIYLLLMAINQITGTILFELEITNIFLANTYLVAQFLTLSLFYYAIFEGKKQRKFILIALAIISTILGVQYAWTPQLFFEYNTMGVIVTSSILILYSIIYFFHYISDSELKLYLVNSGILIYLLGTILLFSIANIGLKLASDIEIALWILNAFIYLVFQIIITTQWFHDRRKNNISNKSL
jgi:hypothetical protein